MAAATAGAAVVRVPAGRLVEAAAAKRSASRMASASQKAARPAARLPRRGSSTDSMPIVWPWARIGAR